MKSKIIIYYEKVFINVGCNYGSFNEQLWYFQRSNEQTQVVLNQANYEVVGTATGECTQVYIIGIGGMSKKSMSESAMSEMYQNANLVGSRAIINANVQYKYSTILGVYTKITAIANGTIIEFKK